MSNSKAFWSFPAVGWFSVFPLEIIRLVYEHSSQLDDRRSSDEKNSGGYHHVHNVDHYQIYHGINYNSLAPYFLWPGDIGMVRAYREPYTIIHIIMYSISAGEVSKLVLSHHCRRRCVLRSRMLQLRNCGVSTRILTIEPSALLT